MANPKVSVIIPTYNRADLLPRTITSVLNQTFKNFELIVVDDGSTDNTKHVVKDFIKQDKRVHYMYQENSGAPAGPTNRGIRLSNGKYIAILQHDDEWLEKKLEKQVHFFDKSTNKKLGFIGCHALVVYKDGSSKIQKLKKYQNLTQAFLCGNVIPYPSAVMMKKDSIHAVGLFDEKFKIADDWDMWLRMSLHYEFDFVDEVLFRYYIHGQNITQTASQLKHAKEIKFLLLKHHGLYKKHPEILAKKLKMLGAFYIREGDTSHGRKYLYRAFVMHKTCTNAMSLIMSYFGKQIWTIARKGHLYRKGIKD